MDILDTDLFTTIQKNKLERKLEEIRNKNHKNPQYFGDETLINLETKKAEEIQKALRKIEDGTYPYCSECGERILIERLEHRPESLYCITCKEQLERQTTPIQEVVYNTTPSKLMFAS